MNSILTYELGLSRWVRAEWSAVEMAPSVDLQWQANWYWSDVAGRWDFKCKITSLSKHLAMMRVNATRQNSSRAIAMECFHTGMMVAVLKTSGDNCRGRGQIENVRKDPGQLLWPDIPSEAVDVDGYALRMTSYFSWLGAQYWVACCLSVCHVLRGSVELKCSSILCL